MSSAQRTVTREFESGSNDRAENMVVFAREALKLLRDILAPVQTL